MLAHLTAPGWKYYGIPSGYDIPQDWEFDEMGNVHLLTASAPQVINCLSYWFFDWTTWAKRSEWCFNGTADSHVETRVKGYIEVESPTILHILRINATEIWKSGLGWERYYSIVVNTSRGGKWSETVLEEGTGLWPNVYDFKVDAGGRFHALVHKSGALYRVLTSGTGIMTEVLDYHANVDMWGEGGAVMRFDASGTAHALWTRYGWDRSPTVYYDDLVHASNDGSGWKEEVLMSSSFPGSGDFPMSPNLIIDRLGNLHIAYFAWPFTKTGVHYRTNCSGVWVDEIVESGANATDLTGRHPSLAISPWGQPHLFYFDDTNVTLRYATKRAAGPLADAGGPYTGYEGAPLILDASASSGGGGILTFRWDFNDDGVADTSWSTSPTATNTWSDDYTGYVRVEVSDGKTTSSATATVTILNLPPRIDSVLIPATNATATLRIAGEKWHDVSAYVIDDGNETLIATLTRQPGKPQESIFPVSIDLARSRRIKVVYTPEDDKVNGQPNGATPAWLTLAFDSGPPVELRHTFNVKHPDTWNWTVGLNQLLAERDVKFAATATDPGSDDLTFTWDWGDGTPAIATTYFNDGIGPDPYPSPDGTYPFTATDSAQHIYSMAGDYSLILVVMDDDGGMVDIVINLVIP